MPLLSPKKGQAFDKLRPNGYRHPGVGGMHLSRKSAGGRPALTLAACILASSLAFVDGSVVNVALPTIGGELGGGAAGLQWVINAYLLPLSALLLLGGAMGDRFGRRRVFLIGLVGFAAASTLCAMAPGLELLLAGRALQGISAAMLMPNSLALLGSSFDGEERGKAIGTWAAAGAIAGAIGPLLGGWLIGTVGWRAIFLINLPLAAGAIALGWAYVALRIIHSLVQAIANKVMLRFAIFVASSLVLIALIVHAAMALF